MIPTVDDSVLLPHLPDAAGVALPGSTITSVASALIPLSVFSAAPYVQATPFKYMYSSYVMEQGASYFGADSLSVSELDNHLYHGALLLLFKGIFGTTCLNNEYLLAVLSSPSIRKLIIDSDYFQDCKKVFALKMLWMLAKQSGTSAMKKIAFQWLKSHLDETPLKYLIKEINESTPTERILLIFKDSLDKLYKLKKAEATLLADDITSQFGELSQGVVNIEKLHSVTSDAHKFLHNFSLDSSESISLFSTRALSHAVGQTALYTTGSPLAICANISAHPTITELSFRIAGCVYALFYPGLVPVLATEALVKFVAKPLAKKLEDYGTELSLVKRNIRNIHEGICEDVRISHGGTHREISEGETLLFETITASLLLLIGSSLHPAVYSFTSVHMIQNLESATTVVTPSKKVDFIGTTTIQAPIALTLTLLHATACAEPAGRAFLNLAAISLTHPFIINKLLKTEVVQIASQFVRDQIPGMKEADELAPAGAIIETLAPMGASKTKLATYALTALRTWESARVIKRITDHLGGIETITERSRQATTSTLTVYGNYATFTAATGVFGPEIGVIALGAGIGKGLSKTTIGISIALGALVYTYTQSPALTSISVTTVHAISETTFATRIGTATKNFFRRWV